MTPEHWQQVQALFLEAVERAPDERRAFLRKACDDADLRAEVEALLAADAASPPRSSMSRRSRHRRCTRRTKHSPPALAKINLPTASGTSSRRIGPYRLVREIGRGGMGTVYLAERDDVEKRVALKLIRGGLAAPETVERFLRERRVLGASRASRTSASSDGCGHDRGCRLPYFVMELRRGRVSITDYCDDRQLTRSPSAFGVVSERVSSRALRPPEPGYPPGSQAGRTSS